MSLDIMRSQGIAWLATIIFIVGCIATLCCTIRYRRQNKEAVHFHRHLIVEWAWTILPFLITLAAAYPAVSRVLEL